MTKWSQKPSFNIYSFMEPSWTISKFLHLSINFLFLVALSFYKEKRTANSGMGFNHFIFL